MQPAIRFAPELLLRAQGLRLAIFDVDGVLTDGRLYYGPQGEELKVFHSLDGHGIKLLAQAGVTPAVITGRDNAALRRRLADLGVREAQFGVKNKAQAAQDLLGRLALSWAQCAAMGDDWPDLPLLQQAAFAVAPPSAHIEVLAQAHYITCKPAGQGAVRELCDLLLCAGGHYAQLLAEQHESLDQVAKPL